VNTEVKRIRGYVIGVDEKKGGIRTWKVRIKDPSHPQNGLKLPVASIRNNIGLARGLNVSFLIGTKDGQEGQKVPFAVDVTIQGFNEKKGQRRIYNV
jgi:hypothetical protein